MSVALKYHLKRYAHIPSKCAHITHRIREIWAFAGFAEKLHRTQTVMSWRLVRALLESQGLNVLKVFLPKNSKSF